MTYLDGDEEDLNEKEYVKACELQAQIDDSRDVVTSDSEEA